MAAELAHAEEQYKLGWMYYYGMGVAEDKAEDAVWFRKAAEQDHARDYKIY